MEKEHVTGKTYHGKEKGRGWEEELGWEVNRRGAERPWPRRDLRRIGNRVEPIREGAAEEL